VSTDIIHPVARGDDAARAARLRARELCRGLTEDDLADDVALVVSELVTNAVRYGLGEITLHLTVDPAQVVVGVRDEGPGQPQLTAAVDVDTEGGRGLALIATLAHEWGVRPVPEGGKVVWCVLGTSPATIGT
jgi:anti-sigma regulatory factor (Ser/Thr protein kinase)